uniref:Uncharacterized protein n=1 Tax=Oryza brachyantha TaxID=4533 RepID=J3N2H4_ORYBR
MEKLLASATLCLVDDRRGLTQDIMVGAPRLISRLLPTYTFNVVAKPPLQSTYPLLGRDVMGKYHQGIVATEGAIAALGDEDKSSVGLDLATPKVEFGGSVTRPVERRSSPWQSSSPSPRPHHQGEVDHQPYLSSKRCQERENQIDGGGSERE